MKILIVEDLQSSALALSRILTLRLGGEVIIAFAHNFAELKTQCHEFNADITVLDPGMPDATRIEVVSYIPEMPPPVIVVTDFEDDGDHSFERFCYTKMAQNYFTKKELRETIVKKAGADLCSAITKAHWRHVLPSRQTEATHAHAVAGYALATLG